MVTVWWRGDRIPAGVGKDPIFFCKGGPLLSPRPFVCFWYNYLIFLLNVYCSAILGNSIDIHTGGVDLKFPHHDNELAQSEVSLKTTCITLYKLQNVVNTSCCRSQGIDPQIYVAQHSKIAHYGKIFFVHDSIFRWMVVSSTLDIKSEGRWFQMLHKKHLWRQNHNDKPVRVHRIFSRPGSVKSWVPNFKIRTVNWSLRQEE